MSAERLITNRLALPRTNAEWELLFNRVLVALGRVPVSRWQFIARLLLVISLSYSLANLFWLVMPTPKIPPAAVAIPAPVNAATSDGQAVNIAQLKSLPVFGKAEAPAAKQDAPVAVDQAVNTSLNLVLMGVISSSDDAAARAIIASGDKQDVYAIGQTLPVGNGVTLSKVLPDRVIISNNGQYESLWLYTNDPNAPPVGQRVEPPPVASQPGPSQPTRNGIGPQTVYGPEAMRTPEAGGEPPGGGVAEVSRTLSDVVAMSIHRENGQVIGYKIRPGRDAEKFRSLGLQTDDIVTAINGMPLTNPAKIMEVYKNMGNTTAATLEIRRGGTAMTVDVVLQ